MKSIATESRSTDVNAVVAYGSTVASSRSFSSGASKRRLGSTTTEMMMTTMTVAGAAVTTTTTIIEEVEIAVAPGGRSSIDGSEVAMASAI